MLLLKFRQDTERIKQVSFPTSVPSSTSNYLIATVNYNFRGNLWNRQISRDLNFAIWPKKGVLKVIKFHEIFLDVDLH